MNRISEPKLLEKSLNFNVHGLSFFSCGLIIIRLNDIIFAHICAKNVSRVLQNPIFINLNITLPANPGNSASAMEIRGREFF